MRTPDFWSKDTGLSRLLEPLGLLYGAVTACRIARAKPEKVSVPVICVGNLTAGGAGKTPVAMALAACLADNNIKVHFLTRGYGGEERGPLRVEPSKHRPLDVGDEPLLLAVVAPTWVSRDRVAGARAAVEAGAQAIIMDDGHQNPSLHKDLSLVVVDGTHGFGNGRLIPSGPLRETVEKGLARASAVVVMGEDKRHIARLCPEGLPVLGAHLAPGAEAHTVKGRRVVAFAGIGQPQRFLHTLRELGASVVAWHPFADHHPYMEADIQPILDEAFGLGAIPVTTAKDAIRLAPDQRQQVTVLTVRAAWDKQEDLSAILEPILISCRNP